MILNRTYRIKLLLLVSLTGGMFLFQNCQVQRPGVEDMNFASVAFPHTGQETSCSSCHETSRPQDTTVFTLPLDPNTPFDYNTHALGTDCISCHNMYTLLRTRADWANGYYDHPSTLSSCVGCHSSQRPGNSPADLARTKGFDHTVAGQGDCFGCHSESLKSSFSSLADWGTSTGAPVQKAWDPAVDIKPVAQMPTFSGTVLSAVTTITPAQDIHMFMNHATTSIPAATLSNCTVCHSSSGTYAGGRFHNAIRTVGVPQPTTCNDCHDASVLPVGLVGLTFANASFPRTPSTAKLFRHDANSWQKNASGNYVRSAIGIINNDCTVCHVMPPAGATFPGAYWQGAKYHDSLTSKGITQPSSCLDCHASSRNTGTTTLGLTNFAHDTDAQGMGECRTCHTGTATWRNGVYHNAGITAPTTCNSCHNYQRPTNTTGWLASGTGSYDSVNKPFDVATHGGVRDCSTCHTPSLFTVMTNWSGGNFNHATANAAGKLTSCQDCHSSQRPTAIINGTGPLPGGNGLAVGSSFNHTTSGQGDCIGCHKASVTNGTYSNLAGWKGGVTYDPVNLMGPAGTPSTVTVIKLNYSNPALFQVASTTSVTQQIPNQMLHSSTNIPASFWTGGVVGSTLDNTKCSTCHTGLPTSYIPGSFHSIVAPAGITSCKECHLNTTPDDIVGAIGIGANVLKTMDHNAALSDGKTAQNSTDCISCHTSPGGSFLVSGFHAKLNTAKPGVTPNTCTTCHYTALPTTEPVAFTDKSAFTTGFRHKSGFAGGDCKLCHSFTNAQLVTLAGGTLASANWNNGSYHKNVAPSSITSCSDCHTKSSLTTLTASTIDNQHMAHTSAYVSNDCAVCHKTDLTAGVTPTVSSWSKSTPFHANVTGVTSCKECHFSTTASLSDTPTTLTNSDTLTTYPSGNTTMFAQMSHTDTTVAGKECNVCHTVVGPVGSKWKSGSYHAKVAVTGTTNCLNCHTNLLTYIRANGNIANGMDHSSTAMGANPDCKSCHTFPGTGVVGSTANPPNWKGAIGGVPSTITLPPPTSRVGVWANLTTAHPSMNLTGESCASCHGATIGAKIVGYDHLNPPAGMKCVYCHVSTQQVVGTVTGFQTVTYTHQGGVSPTADCTNCHGPGGRFVQFAYPTYSPTTGKWSGGKWK